MNLLEQLAAERDRLRALSDAHKRDRIEEKLRAVEELLRVYETRTGKFPAGENDHRNHGSK